MLPTRVLRRTPCGGRGAMLVLLPVLGQAHHFIPPVLRIKRWSRSLLGFIRGSGRRRHVAKQALGPLRGDS